MSVKAEAERIRIEALRQAVRATAPGSADMGDIVNRARFFEDYIRGETLDNEMPPGWRSDGE